MFQRAMTSAVILLGLALAGCGAQPGNAVVKYDRGKETLMTTAPRDATYALYSSTDATPKVSYQLMKGDKLGFDTRNDRIVAVAGSNEVPITTSAVVRTYYWKMQKPK